MRTAPPFQGCRPHARHRLRCWARMVQGEPLLAGHGVPGGAPGSGSGMGSSGGAGAIVHIPSSTWR